MIWDQLDVDKAGRVSFFNFAACVYGAQVAANIVYPFPPTLFALFSSVLEARTRQSSRRLVRSDEFVTHARA